MVLSAVRNAKLAFKAGQDKFEQIRIQRAKKQEEKLIRQERILKQQEKVDVLKARVATQKAARRRNSTLGRISQRIKENQANNANSPFRQGFGKNPFLQDTKKVAAETKKGQREAEQEISKGVKSITVKLR